MKKTILFILILSNYLFAETLNLQQGWNLIGTSSQMSLQELKTKIGDDNLLMVRGGEKTYKKTDTSSLNNFIGFEEGEGYWIKVANSISLEFTPSVSSLTIQLFSGWNLIDPLELSLEELKTKVGDDNLLIVRGEEKTYNKKNQLFLNDFTGFKEPYGYWVKVQNDATITLNTNFDEYSPKEINLPLCDENDPRVLFIKTIQDWENIDDSSKTIFCVKPGNYQSKTIRIKNISGTKNSPKYIILDNDNNSHPTQLDTNQLANVNLRFENSNYWIIDRMAGIGSKIEPLHFFHSSNNIINRHFIDSSDKGITIRDASHNNTIQNSRIQNMSEFGRKDDLTCILLHPRNTPVEIKNTHIINNELHNCNDGFQALWRDGIDVNYEGTVLYANDISVDSSLYTNCNGSKDPNGECSYSENAVDIKMGSKNIDNKIIIKKNNFWGFRKADKTNSKLGDAGTAIVVHYGVKNLQISENTIFNSTIGIISVDRRDASYAMFDSEISDNFIAGILKYPVIVNEALNTLISKNIIVNSPNEKWLTLDKSKNVSIQNNKIVNSVNEIAYKSATDVREKDNLFYENIEDANLADKLFTTNKFSNSPNRVKVLQ